MVSTKLYLEEVLACSKEFLLFRKVHLPLSMAKREVTIVPKEYRQTAEQMGHPPTFKKSFDFINITFQVSLGFPYLFFFLPPHVMISLPFD
jgi:hypothetical protein